MCSNPAPHTTLPADSQISGLWARSHHMNPSITEATFPFPTSPESRTTMPLIFAPAPLPPRVLKRGRALADIDGEFSLLQKKKRRLRLFLITSRLSPEFSSPATNIADRGTNRAAMWAKQKATGRTMLRKTVILNSMRLQTRKMMESKDWGEKLERMLRERAKVEKDKEKAYHEMELLRLMSVYGSPGPNGSTRPLLLEKLSSVPPTPMPNAPERLETPTILEQKMLSLDSLLSSESSDGTSAESSEYQSPNDAYASISTPKSPKSRKAVRDHIPEHPSPLGLSNYDAFDLDEEFPDPYSHFDDDDHDHLKHQAQEEEIDGEGFTERFPAFEAHDHANVELGGSTGPRAPFYSDFHALDPKASCLNDSSAIDEAVWPGTVAGAAIVYVQSSVAAETVSCSPNFSALFATDGRAALRGTTELANASEYRHGTEL